MAYEEEKRVQELEVSEEMKSAYLDYAMSVIASRALPDVRDGLKPVHRRILYAMYERGYNHTKPYRKSARVVGEVLGKYHPHSDAAVYDSVVRMAQEFSMREVLIDGHGNFGSIDGDSAAAMRYTEIRLAPISQYLVESIDEDTVDFVPNYDGTEEEPTVLPTRLPQLLLNGQQGIAVGMATAIPPHNLSELLRALILLIDKPTSTLSDVMTVLPGPDFPTGGRVLGQEGIRQAYLTGRGRIVMRGDAEIVEDSKGRESIIITSLPYAINKAHLVARIAECVKNEEILGISDLRDESNKEGVRIVVQIKRGFSAQTVLLQLYKKTRLQDSFSVNMVCLVNGIPRQLSLIEMLRAFLAHRYDVIVRRSRYRLKKASEREHVLLGLLKVVDSTDEVIQLLRASQDSEEARQKLMEAFHIDTVQAQAILDMRLLRLTRVEGVKIQRELEQVRQVIADLQNLLSDQSRVRAVARQEFEELLQSYPRERLTVLEPTEVSTLQTAELVNPAYVLVTLTRNGYIRRILEDEIRAQRRASRGRRAGGLRAEDVMRATIRTHTHHNLLLFTDRGRVFSLKVYEIPASDLKQRGSLVADLIKLQYGEQVCQMLSVQDHINPKQTYLFFMTERGFVKKTLLEKYENARKNGVIGVNIDEGDRLLNVCVAHNQEHVLLVSRKGRAAHFLLDDVSETGRSSRGVRGMKLDADDCLVAGDVFPNENSEVLLVSEFGYGKRNYLTDYRLAGRYCKGVGAMKVTPQVGAIAAVCHVDKGEDILLVTDGGRILKLSKEEIRFRGRHSKGVRLIRLDENERIVSAGLSWEGYDKEGEDDSAS